MLRVNAGRDVVRREENTSGLEVDALETRRRAGGRKFLSTANFVHKMAVIIAQLWITIGIAEWQDALEERKKLYP